MDSYTTYLAMSQDKNIIFKKRSLPRRGFSFCLVLMNIAIENLLKNNYNERQGKEKSPMKKIAVRQDTSEIETLIAVKVDDICLHNGDWNIEDVDYGYASYEKCDWVDDIRPTYICATCDEVLDEVIHEPEDDYCD